ALDNFFECSSIEHPTKKEEDDAQPQEQRKEQVPKALPTPNMDSFTVMSWNVDGLDKKSLKTRFTAACYIISTISPEVVFLQELSPELVPQLRSNLGGEYSILLSTPSQLYFTGVLLKPNVDYISHKCFPFANSGMGRA
ncbi:unnamed protein product, partial [Anisakis simplex]|uniref:5'-tyrosyl-DNA phosphodiesterase (inferred by orthology to a C. elegans protein) n=1 Tax=Anisakis simplex TaxID=6269 RepID=A0A0M3JLK7_ANISI